MVLLILKKKSVIQKKKKKLLLGEFTGDTDVASVYGNSGRDL